MKPFNLSQHLIRSAVNVLDFGAKGDGVTDDTAAIQAAIASLGVSGAILLPDGRYKVTRQISVPHNFTVVSDGAVIDGSAGFDVAGGENVLYVGSEALTALPDLAGDETVGDTLTSFAAPHGLAAGDVFAIYNPVDFSFSSSRAYYREGEFCEVDTVTSATQVRLTNGLATSHLAAVVKCYKLTTGTFNLVGKLTVKSAQPAVGVRTVAVRLCQVVNSNIAGLTALALGKSYAAIELVRCHKLTLDYTARQSGISVDGDAYGLVIGNSQQVVTRGHASSAGHAISHGGGSGPGCVPNRDMLHRGTWENTGEIARCSVDVHGNAERIAFDGVAKSGMSCGGKSIIFRGTILAETTFGICLLLSEVKKFDFDFTGVRFIGNNIDPAASSHGIIDFGGSGPSEANNLEAGTLRLGGATILAPGATRGILMRKRNAVVTAGARHSIDLRGAKIAISGGGSIGVYADDVAVALNWFKLDLREAEIEALTPVVFANVTQPYMPAQRGNAALNYVTTVAFLAVNVVFATPFPNGYIPNVSAQHRGGVGIGSTLVTGEVNTVTKDGFTFTVFTNTGVNFGANINLSFDWQAE